MYAKFFVVLLSVAAVTAAPPKRDLSSDVGALETEALSVLQSALGTQATAIITTVSGTPMLELSSINGPVVTVATPGASGAVTTTFAGATITVLPPAKKNSAEGLKVSKPLITGVAGVLAAVAGGAAMLL